MKGEIFLDKRGRIRKRLRRPCFRCYETFQPTGRFDKICKKCVIRERVLVNLKRYGISIENILKKYPQDKNKRWHSNLSLSLELLKESLMLFKQNK